MYATLQSFQLSFPLRALSAALFLAAALFGAGCDVAEVNAPVAPLEEAPTEGKLRHAHLMDRAVRVTAVGRGTAPENSVGLIVGLDTYKILDRYGELDLQRILDRYQDIEEYRILDRYEYDHVFDGFAIWADADYLDALLADMEADDEVAWVEPDITVSVTPLGVTLSEGNASETIPWGVARIGAGTGDASSVDLFVIDTGVSHGGDLHLESGLDFTEGSNGTADADGHGTHIAGTAAALTNGAEVRGVAPGARVHPLRVLTGDEVDDSGPVDLSRAIAAVEYVTGEKLRRPNTPMVVNFSLGAEIGTTAYNALDEAIAASINTGVTYVVAAGNSGIDAATVTPAHVQEAITVGAYGPNDAFASFSNYGAVVDLLAPGVDVLSLTSSELSNSAQVAVMSGTSMAAAHVAGAAALVLEQDPHASPQQVASALVSAGQAVIAGTPGATTNRSVWVGPGGALDVELPPFFHYALTAGDDVKVLMGDLSVRVGGSGAANANVFANDRLYFASSGSTVEGFGYYGTSVNRLRTFQPAYNPTGLPSTMLQLPISVPALDVSEFQHLATHTVGTYYMSGDIQLGTPRNPVIGYVNGDLIVNGPAHVSGYGILLVTGSILFNDSITSGASDRSSLALYANGSIEFREEGSSVHAQLFSGG
ncbi:MAG: S8 family serine peptidase, partial [Rhodothermales bacterium]|nr:S8 family serine peptidase [Rhodothermales bacterium]